MKSFMIASVVGLLIFVFVIAATAGPVQAGSASPPPKKTNVEVTLAPSPSSVRSWNWEISHSAGPDEWDLFRGDQGISEFTISMAKAGYTNSFRLSGTATIKNPDPKKPAVVRSVVGSFGNLPVTIDCGLRLPHILKKGESLTCSYSLTPTGGNPANLAVSVKTVGAVGSGGATTRVIFPAPQETNASVKVRNDQGQEWAFSQSGAVTYEKTFACDTDQGTRTSTVTMLETGQQAAAAVQVRCHVLEVSVGGEPLYTRIYIWDVSKTGSQSQVELGIGQTTFVDYTVQAWVARHIDWSPRFKAGASVRNNSPITARNVFVYFYLDGPDPEYFCGDYYTYFLEPGGMHFCPAYPNAPDLSPQTIVAHGVMSNSLYGSDGSYIHGLGTTSFEARATLEFGEPTDESYPCTTVGDSLTGSLGQACHTESPKTFNYSLQIGPYETCGVYQVVNEAYLSDFLATGAWNVEVNVPCEP